MFLNCSLYFNIILFEIFSKAIFGVRNKWYLELEIIRDDHMDFPDGASYREPTWQCRRWDTGLGRSPGGGHSNPLQYSHLENPVDRGAWRGMVHRVAESWTWLKQLSGDPWTHAHIYLNHFAVCQHWTIVQLKKQKSLKFLGANMDTRWRAWRPLGRHFRLKCLQGSQEDVETETHLSLLLKTMKLDSLSMLVLAACLCGLPWGHFSPADPAQSSLCPGWPSPGLQHPDSSPSSRAPRMNGSPSRTALHPDSSAPAPSRILSVYSLQSTRLGSPCLSSSALHVSHILPGTLPVFYPNMALSHPLFFLP